MPLQKKKNQLNNYVFTPKAKRFTWHGGAILLYMYKNKKDLQGLNIVDNDDKEEYCAKKYIIYIDQILQGSNKQDGISVLALLEACVSSLHIQLQFISRLIIQSDNAITY